MIHTMRWFGPSDPVSLSDIRQAGCTGVVTALHHIPVGEVWTVDEIMKRKNLISASEIRNLTWIVVESLPVHEDIKKGLPTREKYIENYKQSIRNLAQCGILTICYNFMPVLDWSRTDLNFEMPDGSKALRFVWEDFAVFDLHILKRPDAKKDYTAAVQKNAAKKFKAMDTAAINLLKDTVLLGLPGSEETFQLEDFQNVLDNYKNIGDKELRAHLYYFIRQVAPVAQEVGAKLCIHPDDPPKSLLGLPRVMSTESDLAQLMSAYDFHANGVTFCTGSFGVRTDNDLPAMVKKFADRIHFIHLRSTKREKNPLDFHEADHLDGDVDMYAVIKEILIEEKKRRQLKNPDYQIPMRPDHGHLMLDDVHKKTYPGYSAIGRLRGLAELRGVEYAVNKEFKSN